MVPDVPRVSGIRARCGRNRAKRNSGGRSEDQNFTHHLAPVVVPPALLVVEITLQARTGFAVSQLQTALPVCAHTYVDVSFDQWRDQELGKRGLSAHLFEHFVTMARLHAANRMPRFHPKSALPTSAAIKRAKSETPGFTRSRPWPTSAATKRAKSETSDFAGMTRP